jgi:pimeloyl-ACP methyl ester carboxylesterase
MTLPEEQRDRQALFAARLEGELAILEPASSALRALGAAGAWLVNRGTRELWDWATRTSPNRLSIGSFFASAERAGELRCFAYELRLGTALKGADHPLGSALRPGTPLQGSKCLTYGWRSNPWQQLTQVRLEGFPGSREAAILRLDGRFLARQGVPLMRITQQENQVVALAEFGSLAATWLRTLASIHLWSFRAPDPAPPHVPQLLPGRLAGMPSPATCELDLEDATAGSAVRVRLTRYGNPGQPPVALVHGYSASGNTFTHPAIPVPLAQHLWQAGHDVWVLDLRTSAAMRTARHAWRFEDAAFADLPVALAHIARETGRPVDVFAHCIGAVMLSMALLTDRQALQRFALPASPGQEADPKRWGEELEALQVNVRRIVLSQKGPALVYCDDNVLRAYFMRVLRRLILPEDYQFHPSEPPRATHTLMDRLLATLPYPPEEFTRENPRLPWRRARWAGFRHRMDALYARDFTLGNLSDKTLDAIDDLFGPLNLETVAQAIHFARQNAITDGTGRPFDMSGAVLAARWPHHGTLSIHGADNGLVDVKTLDLMTAQMAYAGVPYRAHSIEGYGHQDCLIGRRAARDVFPVISDFLQ